MGSPREPKQRSPIPVWQVISKRTNMRRIASLFLVSLCALGLVAQTSQKPTIRIELDATDPARNFFHSKLTIPVSAGPLTLAYPEWIPGNHRPSGPIVNMTGLHIEAAGHSIEWRRDLKDMYAIHLQVPAGVDEITVSLDEITNSGVAGGSGPSASE